MPTVVKLLRVHCDMEVPNCFPILVYIGGGAPGLVTALKAVAS